jgi:hypothetical protein
MTEMVPIYNSTFAIATEVSHDSKTYPVNAVLYISGIKPGDLAVQEMAQAEEVVYAHCGYVLAEAEWKEAAGWRTLESNVVLHVQPGKWDKWYPWPREKGAKHSNKR